MAQATLQPEQATKLPLTRFGNRNLKPISLLEELNLTNGIGSRVHKFNDAKTDEYILTTTEDETEVIDASRLVIKALDKQTVADVLNNDPDLIMAYVEKRKARTGTADEGAVADKKFDDLFEQKLGLGATTGNRLEEQALKIALAHDFEDHRISDRFGGETIRAEVMSKFHESRKDLGKLITKPESETSHRYFTTYLYLDRGELPDAINSINDALKEFDKEFPNHGDPEVVKTKLKMAGVKGMLENIVETPLVPKPGPAHTPAIKPNRGKEGHAP